MAHARPWEWQSPRPARRQRILRDAGTTVVSRNFDTPVKTTDVWVGGLDELTAGRVGGLVDGFLIRAIGG